MSAGFQEGTPAANAEWDSQFGSEDYGIAMIRRQARTIDSRDPYEEQYLGFDAKGDETIFDGGYGDEPEDLLGFRNRHGHIGELIGMEVPNTSVVEVDNHRHVITGELIEEARIKIIQGYLQEIPLPGESIDIAISNWSTFFSPPEVIAKIIQEMERVLRPGGIASWGTNGIGHKDRQHKVIDEIGQILGIETHGPFSANFKLEHVPTIVSAQSDLVHLPERAIHQYTIQILTKGDLDTNLNSYQKPSRPVPSASDFIEARDQSEEYQAMCQQIADIGFALDALRRGIEFFQKPFNP